jgi:hypothetical protein
VKIFRLLGWFLLVVLVAAPLVLSLLSLPAQAADGTTIDLSPTVGLVREYLSVAIEGLFSAAIIWGLRFLHLSGSAKAEELAGQLRDFLHGTVERGIDRALATVSGQLTGVDLRNQLLASVLGYVQANARDAVDRLGASPDDLRRLIEAKLAASGVAGDVPPAGTALPFVRASP